MRIRSAIDWLTVQLRNGSSHGPDGNGRSFARAEARTALSLQPTVLVTGLLTGRSWLRDTTVPMANQLLAGPRLKAAVKLPDRLIRVPHSPPLVRRQTLCSGGGRNPSRRKAQAIDKTFQRVTIHDLRHTAASLAISAGANVKAVQKMLGHASAAMTLDTHADLFDDDLDAVGTALNQAKKDSDVGKTWAKPESED
jgi:integrase